MRARGTRWEWFIRMELPSADQCRIEGGNTEPQSEYGHLSKSLMTQMKNGPPVCGRIEQMHIEEICIF